jgi:cytidyltransferase-like protein
MLGLLPSWFVLYIAHPPPHLTHRAANLHTGHAGAMLQARQLGNELVVGIHSDEAILENKGPTVMTLEER